MAADKNVEYLLQQIKQLKPEQRETLDDQLLGMLADDATAMRRQYGLELASDYIEDAKLLVDTWGKTQGLTSSMPTIDKLTKGMVGGEIIVFGGATSKGKTTLAVNIAARVVAQNVPVLFVTLEMTKAQLTSRMMVSYDGFERYAHLLTYQKNDELNWQSIDGLIANAVKEMGVQLVVIDHLHYFTRELVNVSEDLGRITKEFKKNAVRHNIPIILISHTRKGSGDSIDELRGSSYIAQDADIVMMVTRDADDENFMKVILEKNRNRGVDFKNNEAILEIDRTRLIDPEDWTKPPDERYSH